MRWRRSWSHYPLVVLATVATVIASQAIISGAYSMTQQAINLGFLPRMNVVHTEGREIGQIYVPFVNWALAAGTLAAVIGFGSSDALAGAFGIAVSLLMVITTLMATFVALHWKHNPLIVYGVNGSLLAPRPAVLRLDVHQAFDGGWFPLLIAFVISFLMLTWRKGEEIMDVVRLEVRQRATLRRAPARRSADAAPGDGDRLGRMAKGVPLALSHNVNYNRVLHENVLLVAVATTEMPRAPDEERSWSRRSPRASPAPSCVSASWRSRTFPRELAEAMASGKIAQVRSRQSDLLHRPRDHHPIGPAPGHAALARGDLRLHASQRPTSRRLFQDSRLANHGDRRRVRDLTGGARETKAAPRNK